MDTRSTDGPNTKNGKSSQASENELLAGQPPRERSSKFWFDDGNIVLQTSIMMFRVHKSVLKLHSTIFADMFAIPQPNDQPTVDGCPIVELTDTSDDWRVLLGFLYRTTSVYIKKTRVICTTDMLAMLRLGQKYGFEDFREEAIEQLRLLYPRTVKQLEVILDSSSSASNNSNELQRVPDGHEFNILQTVIDLRIQTVLPMAYYFCVRNRSLADIFTGQDVSATADDTDHLSAETKAALVIGKEKILVNYPAVTFSYTKWLHARPSASCISPQPCQTAAHRIAVSLAEVEHGIHRALDPDPGHYGFCMKCEPIWKAAHDIGRQALIDALPSYFGLPPWDELKDF